MGPGCCCDSIPALGEKAQNNGKETRHCAGGFLFSSRLTVAEDFSSLKDEDTENQRVQSN